MKEQTDTICPEVNGRTIERVALTGDGCGLDYYITLYFTDGTRADLWSTGDYDSTQLVLEMVTE